MSLPPVFAASALYDNLLQAALRQFFGRATFETEADPVAFVRRPSGDRADQRSLGAVDPLVRIAARAARAGAASVHRARSAAGAGDRRRARGCATGRSSIRSRCSSAASCSAARSRIATSARFSTRRPTAIRSRRAPIWSRPRIEVLRVAALSSYENRSISSGVLHSRRRRRSASPARRDPAIRRTAIRRRSPAIKSFYRLCDGLQTLFLVNRTGVRARHRRHVRATHGGAAGCAVPVALPFARAGHRRQPQCLRRAQPVARDQALRGRRPGVQFPQRALAPARPACQVRDVGRVGRQPRARGAVVPDRAGPRRRARGRAVRRAARPRGVAAAAGRARRPARRAAAPRNVDAPTRAQLLHMLQGRTATEHRSRGALGTGPDRRRHRAGPTGRLLAVGAILLHSEPVEPHSTSRWKARARPRRWPPAATARC